MNRHALQVLQFDEALDVVAGNASSALGAAAVRSLEPSDALAWVVEELRRVEQMSAFLLRAQDWGMPAIPDLRGPLRHLAVEGSVWEPAWLRDAAVLLESSAETRQAVLQHGDDHPLLAAVAGRLIRLEEVVRSLRRAIDAGGEVRDEASRELLRLRREIRSVRSRIVERLERYVASLPDRYRVSDASVSVRDGRYVIPIRREGRGEVGGIVHDESATGSTLFVEPPVAIEMMNQLRGLEAAEARELLRILRELTELLRPHADELAAALEALVALDSIYARARFALRHDGRRPEMLPSGSEEYAVVEGYHALLLEGGEPVVPFDLEMRQPERTLLVSGPNTGGKTVLLKALGLVSALAQAGIIPPVAAGTRLPVFGDIFADIGDEQSIAASLSTFSAHLKNIGEILAEADHTSLVLIDEVGSGTDPAEGGALARAVLLELSRRSAFTVATTHLGELKLLAGETGVVVNASLQFDPVELRPTFRLVKGIPGRSYGLAIARRLGLPAPLLAEAEAYLPEGEREASHLLLELEEKERAMAAALREAESQRRAAVTLRRDLDEREHRVRKREREAESQSRRQAREALLAARAEVEDAIRDLRRAADAGVSLEEAARAARRRVEEAARRHEPGSAADEHAAGGAVGAPGLAAGQRVRVAATGATGMLVELRDGRATVEVAGVRLQVAAAGLEATGEATGEAAGEAAGGPGGAAQRGGWRGPETDAATEVDLRGARADEVAGLLLPALDAALRSELPSLRIIHGKGTGALRQVVAELLKREPRVRAYRGGEPGEGGTGVTVAELT
jgi:DNA mismatch repair protein MutS2